MREGGNYSARHEHRTIKIISESVTGIEAMTFSTPVVWAVVLQFT